MPSTYLLTGNNMSTEVWIFLGGQAIVLLLSIIGTYVKIAVRLKEIELKITHADKSSTANHDDLRLLRNDLQKLTLKVEHVQTMQQMLCQACPFRPGNNQPAKGTMK